MAASFWRKGIPGLFQVPTRLGNNLRNCNILKVSLLAGSYFKMCTFSEHFKIRNFHNDVTFLHHTQLCSRENENENDRLKATIHFSFVLLTLS